MCEQSSLQGTLLPPNLQYIRQKISLVFLMNFFLDVQYFVWRQYFITAYTWSYLFWVIIVITHFLFQTTFFQRLRIFTKQSA